MTIALGAVKQIVSTTFLNQDGVSNIKDLNTKTGISETKDPAMPPTAPIETNNDFLLFISLSNNVLILSR